MTSYFISDNHFNHERIFEFEPEARPFASAEEMNREMVRRWNSVVTNQDRVYVAGDLSFGGVGKLQIIKELNGNITLISGNHDMNKAQAYVDVGVRRIHGAMEYKGFIITHIPIYPREFYHHGNEGGSRYIGNIHGHLHSDDIDDPRYFNLSAEHHNLTPITFKQLLRKWHDKADRLELSITA